jgi:hypothetical protein
VIFSLGCSSKQEQDQEKETSRLIIEQLRKGSHRRPELEPLIKLVNPFVGLSAQKRK